MENLKDSKLKINRRLRENLVKENIGEEEMLKRATGNPAVFDHDPSLE